VCCFCRISTRNITWHISVRNPRIRFYTIPSFEIRVFPWRQTGDRADGWTDMTKLNTRFLFLRIRLHVKFWPPWLAKLYYLVLVNIIVLTAFHCPCIFHWKYFVHSSTRITFCMVFEPRGQSRKNGYIKILSLFDFVYKHFRKLVRVSFPLYSPFFLSTQNCYIFRRKV